MIAIGCMDIGGTKGVVQLWPLFLEKGHDVRIFCNGVGQRDLNEAGIPFTETGDPEVVVKAIMSDCQLWVTTMDQPGSIGIATAKRLREIDPDLPIIALSDYPTSATLRSEEWQGFRPDLITAGDGVNARVIQQGWPDYPTKNIRVVGYPAFDRFDDFNVPAIRNELRQELGLTSDAFLAVLFTNIDDTPELARQFVKAMPTGSSNFFSVRPHPRMAERATDLFEETQRILSPYGDRCLDTSKFATDRMICAADVVISPCSTVSGEAAALRVAGINYYPPFIEKWYLDSIGGIVSHFPWSELGVVAEAWGIEGLAQLLNEAKAGQLKGYLRQAQEHYFPKGMKCSRDIVEMLLSVIR